MDNNTVDMNWIEDEHRLHNLHGEPQKERMDQITMNFIYINRSHYINKVLVEDYVFSTTDLSGSRIPLNQLLKIIQTHKLRTPTSLYRLANVKSYIVDLDACDMQTYSECDETELSTTRFFKEEIPTRDILIPDSMFVFHNINAIYFIYQEFELEIENNPHKMKSILKTEIKQPRREPNGKMTKKVRIEDKNRRTVQSTTRKKGTRKRGVR